MSMKNKQTPNLFSAFKCLLFVAFAVVLTIVFA